MADVPVVSIKDAIASTVTPGMHLHFALTGARANGSMREVVRQFRGANPRFTVSAASIGGLQLGLFLIETGLVARVISSFIGDGYPVPSPSRRVKGMIDRGEVQTEEWSLLTIVQALRAAAAGVPGTVSRSLVSTDLGKGRVEIITIGGQQVSIIPALTPDVTFLHGVVSDTDGNTVLALPLGEGIAGACAAKLGTIVTTEQIVSKEEFRRYAGLPILPSNFVRSLSLLRYGSHPSGIFAPLTGGNLDYADDYEAAEAATEALNSDEAIESYIDRWVAVDEQRYSDLVGAARWQELEAIARGELSMETKPRDGSATRAEVLVTNASQIVARAVREMSPDSVLAGVGLSCLSCWLAATSATSFPPLVSELGFFDYTPQFGNPFLFAYPNLRNTSVLAGVDELLGFITQGRSTRTLAILAAGQVDRFGNINTSHIGDSGWLTGSGGASDIAETAEAVIVVVPHRRGRLVSKVDYVTSPGHRTRWIVTDRAAIAMRPNGGSSIEAVLPAPGASLLDAAEEIRRDLPWDAAISDDLYALEPVTPRGLETLRRYDPRGFFLGTPGPAGRMEGPS